MWLELPLVPPMDRQTEDHLLRTEEEGGEEGEVVKKWNWQKRVLIIKYPLLCMC